MTFELITPRSIFSIVYTTGQTTPEEKISLLLKNEQKQSEKKR
jgi:hypothetical protein